MRILIIGGTGFIGSALTRLLVQDGHRIALFHRNKATAEVNLNTTEIIGSWDDIIHFKKHFISFKPDLVVDTIAYTAHDL